LHGGISSDHPLSRSDLEMLRNVAGRATRGHWHIREDGQWWEIRVRQGSADKLIGRFSKHTPGVIVPNDADTGYIALFGPDVTKALLDRIAELEQGANRGRGGDD
jgi:hypothetical protein